MANMVGNTAQDVGTLGGVAGSTGVAIGQMAEYMADAAFNGEKLGSVALNFAKVAGPILAIGAAIGTFQAVLGNLKKDEEEAAEATEALGSAFQQTGDWVMAATQVLREQSGDLENYTNRITNFGEAINSTFIGKGLSHLPAIGDAFKQVTTDVVAGLEAVGLSTDALAETTEGNVIFNREFEQALLDGLEAGKLTEQEYKDITDAAHGYQAAVKLAKEEQERLNLTGRSFGLLFEALTFQQAPLEHFTDLWDQLFSAIKAGDEEGAAALSNTLAGLLHIADPAQVVAIAVGEIDKRQEGAAKSAEELAKQEKELAEQVADVAEAAAEASAEWAAMADEISETSFQEAIDNFNSLSELDLAQMRQNTVGAFDSVKEAIKTAAEEVDNWGRMDLTPDSYDELKGMPDQFGAITDAISGMRSSIQTELKAAFDTGGIQEFSAKFDFFAGEVRQQFTDMFRGMGLPEDQVQAQVNRILADLSLLPESKEIIIQLTLAQEGRNALDLFMDEITGLEALNPEVDIKTKIAAGDIAGALAELNALRIAAGRDPIVLPTEVSRVGLETATANAVKAANDYARNNPAVIPATVNPRPTGAATARGQAQSDLTRLGPVQIPVTLVVPKWQQRPTGVAIPVDSGGTIPPGNIGLVAEKRPEIINDKYLVTQPTLVPAGTRVTSGARTARILRTRGTRGLRGYDSGGTVVAGPRTINVNVNAAVVGNRFDVARAVARADRVTSTG